MKKYVENAIAITIIVAIIFVVFSLVLNFLIGQVSLDSYTWQEFCEMFPKRELLMRVKNAGRILIVCGGVVSALVALLMDLVKE